MDDFRWELNDRMSEPNDTTCRWFETMNSYNKKLVCKCFGIYYINKFNKSKRKKINNALNYISTIRSETLSKDKCNIDFIKNMKDSNMKKQIFTFIEHSDIELLHETREVECTCLENWNYDLHEYYLCDCGSGTFYELFARQRKDTV